MFIFIVYTEHPEAHMNISPILSMSHRTALRHLWLYLCTLTVRMHFSIYFTCVLVSVRVNMCDYRQCVCDVSYYARLGVGMCGMLGDVNGDIPVALTPWTTAENDRFKRRGGEEGKKRGEEGRREEENGEEEIKGVKQRKEEDGRKI